MTFKFSTSGKLNRKGRKLLASLREAAQQSDTRAIYSLALMSEMFPKENILSTDKKNEYLLLAAQNGLSEAQYELGQRLMHGRYCEVDYKKGQNWVQMAAANGFNSARFDIAQKILKSDEGDKNFAWQNLLDAANSGHSNSTAFLYTALFSAENIDKTKLYNQAVKAYKDDKDNPDFIRIKAMHEAVNQRFKEAQNIAGSAAKNKDIDFEQRKMLRQDADAYKLRQMPQSEIHGIPDFILDAYAL